MTAELDAVDLFDVQVGSTVYRVFLLPGKLQVDVSFTPEAEFGALGLNFRLRFGTAVQRPGGQAAALWSGTARHQFGLGAHHAVRARFPHPSGAGHGRPSIGSAALATLEPALVVSLDRSELLPALNAAVDALLGGRGDTRAG